MSDRIVPITKYARQAIDGYGVVRDGKVVEIKRTAREAKQWAKDNPPKEAKA